MTDKLAELLAETKAIMERATPLPYKHFPIVMIGSEDNEQANLMNEYLKLGMYARTMAPALIEVIEAMHAQRTDAYDVLGKLGHELTGYLDKKWQTEVADAELALILRKAGDK